MSDELNEARALLAAARDLLAERWFVSSDGEDYSDEDVIAMTDRIDAFLAVPTPPATPTRWP